MIKSILSSHHDNSNNNSCTVRTGGIVEPALDMEPPARQYPARQARSSSQIYRISLHMFSSVVPIFRR